MKRKHIEGSVVWVRLGRKSSIFLPAKKILMKVGVVFLFGGKKYFTAAKYTLFNYNV